MQVNIYVAYDFKQFHDDVSDTITESVENTGNFIRATGEELTQTAITQIKDAPNLPIAPGVTVGGVVKSVTKGDVQDLTASLGKITGIESLQTPPENFKDTGRFVNDVIREGTGIDVKESTQDITNILKQPSAAKLKNIFNDEISSIKEQLIQQIAGCIEAEINKIRNILHGKGIPGIPGIPGLEPDLVIRQRIGEFRLKVVRDIRREIEKFKYEKLKIHQVAIYRQKIQKAIRSICHAPPSTNRKYQLDNILKRTKELANDGEKRKVKINLGISKARDATSDILERFKNPKISPIVYTTEYTEVDYDEIQKNGYKDTVLNAAANNVSIKIEKEMIKQSKGYQSTTLLDFVDPDGNLL